MTDDMVRVARRLADERLAPLAERIDREQQFSPELWRELFGFGLPAIPFPDELGGAGATYLQYCDVVETIARRCAVSTTYSRLL